MDFKKGRRNNSIKGGIQYGNDVGDYAGDSILTVCPYHTLFLNDR